MNRFSAFVFAILCSVTLWAYDVKVDDIYYNLDKSNKTAEVTHGTISFFYYSGSVEIPQTITADNDSYTVTAVGDSAFWYCRLLTSVKMPNTIKRIGDYAMQGCSILKTVGMSNAVNSIGEYAFAGDGNIIGLVLPSTLQKVKDYAFFRCSGIERFDIPDATTEIGSYAFAECAAATITIGNGLKTLGSSAFSDNSRLTAISLPASLKRIEYYTFENCTSLKDVTLNEGLEYIGERAFSSAVIESITLPASLNTLDFGVFRFNKNLKSITCLSSAPPAADDIFYGGDVSKCTLYVPAESVDLYKADASWNVVSAIAPITPTGIKAVATNVNTGSRNGKFIQNGCLVIVINSIKYNVAGQIVR